MSLPIKVVKNFVVFPVRDPARVRAVFPDVRISEIKGQFICAVPHDLSSTRFFANQGHKLPSPITTGYAWPGRFKPYEHQVDTAEFLTINRRAYNLSGMGCVDATTEFLTPTGWKPIADYRDGDLVAQYTEGGYAQFVLPTGYIKLPCDTMYRFKTTRGVDQLLSPEHRVYYTTESGHGRVITAQEMFDAPDDWRGKFVTTFIGGSTGMDRPLPQLRLMVAVIADGHFACGTNHCVVRLKKERKKDRMRWLLQQAGIEWRERSNDTATAQGFTVFTFYAPWKEKTFGAHWWAASFGQLSVIVAETRHWDGSERKAGSFSFHTRERASADFIQYAAAATGNTAFLMETHRTRDDKPETDYTVYVQSTARRVGLKGIGANKQLRRNKWVEPSPDGYKYCFAVPATFWIARRNGNIFVTGNTGKSKSALWAVDYLMKKGEVSKCLIVAPLSTLDRVWAQEIFETLPHRRYHILHGSRQKRMDLLADPKADFLVINPDGVEIIADALKDRPDINHIVLDEIAVFRNSRTKRFKTMFHILNRQGIERSAWGLTGTPTPTAPTDCYGQIRLITPERYKGSFKALQNELMWQVSQFKWAPKTGSAERVIELMKPSIRYALEDCIDLPPTIWQERHAPLSPEQQKHYNEMRKHAFTEIDGRPITAVNAGVLLSKLCQASLGILYDGQGGIVEMDFGPRLNVIREVIEESNEKVILFVPFTGALNALYDQLKNDWTVEIIDGSVPAGKRNRIFKDFQSGKNPHILLAHPGTMAHGLTLTAATTICWAAPVCSCEIFAQANARIARPGQTKVTNIVMIEGSPAERGLYTTLKERGKLQDLVLDLAKG